MARHPELLIPASSLEVLKTAVIFGADAVYIGGEAFSLRAKAKNFTKEDMRNKITFTYEFVGGIVASIFSILGGLLLNAVNVQNGFLIVGAISLIVMILTLTYMKTRFGLKPEEYRKEDIEFEVDLH